MLTPGTRGVRPGLPPIAPAGLETNETLEPKAALVLPIECDVNSSATRPTAVAGRTVVCGRRRWGAGAPPAEHSTIYGESDAIE